MLNCRIDYLIVPVLILGRISAYHQAVLASACDTDTGLCNCRNLSLFISQSSNNIAALRQRLKVGITGIFAHIRIVIIVIKAEYIDIGIAWIA